ncbi:MAG: hypothetical protein AAFR16_12765 [Pseudomonadota bacterium]
MRDISQSLVSWEKAMGKYFLVLGLAWFGLSSYVDYLSDVANAREERQAQAIAEFGLTETAAAFVAPCVRSASTHKVRLTTRSPVTGEQDAAPVDRARACACIASRTPAAGDPGSVLDAAAVYDAFLDAADQPHRMSHHLAALEQMSSDRGVAALRLAQMSNELVQASAVCARSDKLRAGVSGTAAGRS